MPFIKISQLTTATAVSATNQFEINQNGASRSAEVSVVAAYVRSSATDVLVLPAGSAAAPALFPTGDTNTGIFFPAADTIAFTEGGVESMRLDSSGNLGIGVAPGGVRVNVSVNSSSDAVRITQTGTGNALVVEDSANPDATPFVIGPDGEVRIGFTGSVPVGSGIARQFQSIVLGDPAGGSGGASFSRFSNDASGAVFALGKSRGTSASQFTVVSSGDSLGAIRWAGSDGTDLISQAAEIRADVDGTPGNDDMPGRLVFSTTADGASSPTERMRIDSNGSVGIGFASPVQHTLRVGRNIAGNTFSSGVVSDGQVQSGVTSRADYFLSAASCVAGTYSTINGYQAQQSTFSGTVSRQNGFRADASLVGATNNSGFTAEDTAAVTAGRSAFGFLSNVNTATGGGATFGFYASGTAPNFFNGNVFLGTTTQRTIAGQAPEFLIERAAAARSAIVRNTNDANGPVFFTSKSRGTANGSFAVVASGDALGTWNFAGSDGTADVIAAQIRADVDGTPGTNDMPGRLVFSTTADGASSPTERMRIDNTGNVGIGTASPAARLDVSPAVRATGSGGSFAAINGGNVDGANIQLCRAGSGTQNAFLGQFQGSLFLKNLDSGFIAITTTTSDVERMRITAGGNVGIGTSAPIAPLTVANASADPLIALNATGTQPNAITFYRNGVSNGAIYQENAGAFHIRNVATQPAIFWTNNLERMRITSDGNVAIGTGVANARLAFDNATAANGFDANKIRLFDDGSAIYGFGIAGGILGYRAENHIFYTNAVSPAARLTINNNGLTGVSTIARSLELTGVVPGSPANFDAQELIKINATAAVSGLTFSGTDGRLATLTVTPANEIVLRTNKVGLAATEYAVFYTGGANERMRINSNGNVGIGTSNPVARLDVAGFVRFGNYGGTFQGVTLQNNNNSALAETFSYIDTQNNLGTTDSHAFFVHQPDGGSYIAFGTTPPGSRTSDRRVERMRINAAGNVLIGTSSSFADAMLTVRGSAADTRRIIVENASTAVGTAARYDLVTGTTNSYALWTLFEDGAGGATFDLGCGPAVVNGLFMSSGTSSAPIVLRQSTTERARIDSSGNFLVGTSSLGSNVSGIELRPTVGGNAHPRIELNKTFSGTATLISFQHNKGEIGRITCDNSSTAYVTSSDYRLKHDVQPLAGGLATIAALKPSTYKWNVDNSHGEGFIAHELAEHIPLAVSGEKDAVDEDGSIKAQGVDYSKIVVHLVAAVQELKAENDALKARIATLEAR